MLSVRPAATIRVAPHPGRAILSAMTSPVLVVHGPAAAEVPLVLDSPHSGRTMPADFGSVRSEAELREGEDSFIDELYQPATARGIPLLAALFPRTYLDVNRHAGDIDPELLSEPWPQLLAPSAKARIGKALVWRTLEGDRPIYDRRLSVAEMQRRIQRCHRPYHATLQGLLDGAHARFGAVWHINCHAMGPNTSVSIEGVAGRPRADIVLGDRDGTTCAPEFTAFVRDTLAGHGYRVQVNEPFKGVELVRAQGHPASGRHSLQLEVNKRLYMETDSLRKHAGFELLQGHLMALLDSILARFGADAATQTLSPNP